MDLDYVLINPPGLKKDKHNQSDECLGLGYINASLQSSFIGYIVNCCANSIGIDELFANDRLVKDIFSSMFIGISCNYFSTVPSTVKLVENLRARGYKGFICLGGHQAVLIKDRLLKELPIDAVSNGDGEISIFTLIDALKAHSFNYQIPGFYYKHKGNIIRNYAQPIWPALDELAFPTRLGEKTHPLFNTDAFDKGATAHISTSRGCPFQCTYCDISMFYGRNRRQRSINNVINEIEYLCNSRQISHFIFTDDNFIGSSKAGILRAKDFVQALNERHLPIQFSMEMRVTDVSRDLLTDLLGVGLKTINLGVESGSQSMLDRWKKGIKVEDSIRAIQIAESLGVQYNINFILVDAYTTMTELMESYTFLKKIRAVERSDVFFHLFTNELGVIDGTNLAHSMESTNLLASYKVRLSTPEEQRLLNYYHPIYSYRFTDPRVRAFAENNRHWTSIVEDIMASLPFEDSNSRGFRLFCFKLFSMSIRAAENMDIICDELDAEIGQFCKIRNISYDQKLGE